MTQNPDVYPEPDKFRPERFMRIDPKLAEQNDPRKFVFGFGRRHVSFFPYSAHSRSTNSLRPLQVVPRAGLRRIKYMACSRKPCRNHGHC